jgi:hypothetical protein
VQHLTDQMNARLRGAYTPKPTPTEPHHHRHEHDGQALEHNHPHDGPHGYYGHPEDRGSSAYLADLQALADYHGWEA